MEFSTSAAVLILCAFAAAYTWFTAIVSFRKTTYEIVTPRILRIKRLLIASFLIALITSIIGLVSGFAMIGRAPPEERAAILQQRIDKQLIPETYGAVIAILLGYSLLRGRAGYLQANSKPEAGKSVA